jgi:hypothetical protein
MFHPRFLHRAHVAWPNWLCLLRKQMFLALLSLLILFALDIIRATTGYWRPGLHIGLTFAFVVTLVLLLQIVLTNRTVPGANDNLTGCIALVALAERMEAAKPDDVELVFVVTGCEESGRGGSWALWRAMHKHWTRENTLVLGLDTLSGGVLRYHIEGEILPIWPARNLRQCIATVAASDDRFAGMTPYHAPAGATDVAPFVCHGYQGLCLVSVDPHSDLPRDYHVPADDLQNINFRHVANAVDFAEKLILECCALKSRL